MSQEFLKIPVALHPQSDRMVEKVNSTLEQRLSKLADENQTEWDLCTPLFVMVYRLSVHNPTGMAPAKLVFSGKLSSWGHDVWIT